MRRFAFTLEPVARYKRTVEKLQRAELTAARDALKARLREDEELVRTFERGRESFLSLLSGDAAAGVNELIAFDRFLEGVHDARRRLAVEIRRAEEEVARCETQLITTMKELKVYGKLRDAQYQEYLKELQSEDEKNIGDLVSFDVISDTA